MDEARRSAGHRRARRRAPRDRRGEHLHGAALSVARKRPGAGKRLNRTARTVPLLLLAGAALGGCVGGSHVRPRPAADDAPLPADYLPLPPGRSRAYRLSPTSPAVAHRARVDDLRCERAPAAPRFGVHLELYAHRLVVPVPAGIGLAPPLRRRGAYVTAGVCAYPVRTREPTGVVELSRAGLQLGALFALWGQPLGARRLASFPGALTAFVGGHRWPGDPRAIPLRRHAEIVLETGGYVPPHPRYLFPDDL